MKSLFHRQTFRYFVDAKKNFVKGKNKKDWFSQNLFKYETHVKEPFGFLLREIEHRLGPRLSRIDIHPRKLSRPLRPKGKADEIGLVRASAMFYLSEKQTSIFEWNPGLYMQLGDEKIDNVIGMGLYGPSSRQIKRLRAAFVKDFSTVDQILRDRKLRKYWGSPAPEKYVRFPKDYSPEDPAAKYLWYKQFYLRRQFTRQEVLASNFAETVLRSFEAGLPFLAWIRNAIGVYDRMEMEREKRERMDLRDAQNL
jgi:uncharacterized protein (DUF2461 family)